MKKEKKALIQKLGEKYIDKTTSKFTSKKSQAYILSDLQKKNLRKISIQTYLFAALIGALAVLIVVLPHHIWPNLFGIQKFNLFGNKFDFEAYYTLFAILLLFPEIWALNYINLRAVKKICIICNYPNKQRKDYEEQIAILSDAGLEIQANHLKSFSIDPYIGLSKFSYYSVFLLNKLKATLLNLVVKILIKRFMGRYALRIVTDLAGIPVFAFWNAWASRSIIKETRMRIMATTATDDFLEEISVEDLKKIEDKIGLIFNFVAQSKRSYNFAMYVYFKEVVKLIPNLNLKITHEIQEEELFTGEVEKDRLIAKLLIFGLIIDGSLSIKEKLVLKNLCEHTWFPYSVDELELAVDGFCDGKGLPLL